MSEFLKPAASLVEFFTSKVKASLEHQGLSVSGEVEFYIVQLLTHFANSENLFTVNPEGHKELRPLALRLYDATFDSPERKFTHLKNLGDTALYQAGVFYDGVHTSSTSIDYFISMGGQAYHSLANLTTSYEKTLSEMFAELGERFAQLVEILKLTCERENASASDHDLLKLFERYQKTGSVSARRILEEKGLILPSAPGGKIVQ